MSRGLRQRIEKLEGDRGNQGIPDVIVATCPIPESEKPLNQETIERWLADGRAHLAFKGHAVLYDGGRSRALTTDEWQAHYRASTTLDPPRILSGARGSPPA